MYLLIFSIALLFMLPEVEAKKEVIMKKTIYFHIGSNKTGSSALQAFFSENSAILEEKGIYYPPQPKYWNEKFKISSGNAQHLFDDCDKYELDEKGKNKIDNIISLTEKHNKILLSSEWLWPINDKTAFFNNFKRDNIEIIVIVYLRRQDEYFESAINQRIKVSKYRTIAYPECLNPKDELNSPLEELNYHKELEKIKLSIGASNIIVKPYEKEQFKNNNIFSDFLNILNLELTDEFTLPPKEVNPRLNRDFTEIKRIWNSLPIDEETLFKVFCEHLITLSINSDNNFKESNESLFSYKEKLEILHKYDESNQNIAKEYLGRSDGKLFISLPHKNDEISEPYSGPTKESVIQAFGYLYCKQFKEIEELKNKNSHQDLRIDENVEIVKENSSKINLLLEENKKLEDKINNNAEKLKETSSQIDLLLEENKKLVKHYSVLEDKFNNNESEYHRVIKSRSWKITKPLRRAKQLLLKLKEKLI